MGIVIILYLAVVIFLIAAMWKMFAKAGQPGWACLVPIYNLYVLTQIAKKPGWWVLLCLIPIVNYVILIMIYHGVSVSFGKGVGFTVGMIFLPFVFIPILGFGDAQYQHEGAAGGNSDVLDS